MKVTARWPHPSRNTRFAFAVVGLLIVLFGTTSMCIAYIAVGVAWFVYRLTIVVSGGGFRPLRMIDLIEFAADDQLRAWEMEQARK